MSVVYLYFLKTTVIYITFYRKGTLFHLATRKLSKWNLRFCLPIYCADNLSSTSIHIMHSPRVFSIRTWEKTLILYCGCSCYLVAMDFSTRTGSCTASHWQYTISRSWCTVMRSGTTWTTYIFSGRIMRLHMRLYQCYHNRFPPRIPKGCWVGPLAASVRRTSPTSYIHQTSRGQPHTYKSALQLYIHMWPRPMLSPSIICLHPPKRAARAGCSDGISRV
jgi:hypothetical protein